MPDHQNNELAKVEQSLEEYMEPPEWLTKLREAMIDSLRPEDLKDIMKHQVEKARGGDAKSAQFVFDQANKLIQSGGAKPSAITITQNVFHERPDVQTESSPRSEEKIQLMQKRRVANLPLTDPRDRQLPADVKMVESDEEEKAFRRSLDDDED